MKFIILGDGLLGGEFHRQTGWDIISRKKDGFDITQPLTFTILPSTPNTTFINCIANTDTYSKDKQAHWDVNVKGTQNLLNFCENWGSKLVHISTDYIYSNSKPYTTEEDIPVHCENWYGYTKLIADALVQLNNPKHLIIRETHKPNPFPYSQAWDDQIGNFDYVDKIVSLITILIENRCEGIYNVGTEVKSIYHLAQQTNQVIPINKPQQVPSNTTMNLDKLNNVIKRISK
jgi:dTDP-4-dehydrorhamnose reductase